MWKGDEIRRWGDHRSWGASMQLPGCPGSCGHHSGFVGTPCRRFPHPGMKFSTFMSMSLCLHFVLDLSGNGLGPFKFFCGLHPSLFVLPTPWHHFCSCIVLKRKIGSRKVLPYLCTAPSFQAHPGLILTLTPHCPGFHRHAPDRWIKLFIQIKRVAK